MQKREKRKVNLIKTIGFLLFLLGIVFIVYEVSFNYFEKKIEDEYIESYMKNYNNEGNSVNIVNSKGNKNNFKSRYVAILDIPKINLKKGLVRATKDFKSINHAVSIDKNSKLPNEKGNFILYAHAGNSKISYFKNLDKLEVGNEVRIYYLDKTYSYKVNKKYEIDKTGFLTLNETTSDHNLILVTCVHNTNKQLIIICTLENTY